MTNTCNDWDYKQTGKPNVIDMVSSSSEIPSFNSSFYAASIIPNSIVSILDVPPKEHVGDGLGMKWFQPVNTLVDGWGGKPYV